MAHQDTTSVTVTEIIAGAIRLIEDFGWERQAWPEHGPMPRCIRAALWDSSKQLHCNMRSIHLSAVRRVSEAIYDKRGTIGGITDWEFKRRVDQATVLAVLHKAIEMGEANGSPALPR